MGAACNHQHHVLALLVPLVDLETVAVGLGYEEAALPVQAHRNGAPKVGLGLRGYVVRSV